MRQCCHVSRIVQFVFLVVLVWTTVQTPEGAIEPLPRAFCQFIMTPINQLMHAVMIGDSVKYEEMIGALGIVLAGGNKLLGDSYYTLLAFNSLTVGRGFSHEHVKRIPRCRALMKLDKSSIGECRRMHPEMER